ncbi:MAG: hypothetical protein JRH20_27840 [Deltaproteobacteria bacterium]|nr:hypothetical protein [Deltaproteobacteria bacterium]
MFKRLFDFFSKGDVAALQGQREGLLDLLVLGMFIDHHVANAEGTFIQEQARRFEWDGADTMERFIDQSTGRARDVMGSEGATTAYLKEIAQLLSTSEAKTQALQIFEELLTVDGQLAPREEELLTKARVHLVL